jgi:ATP-dependent RNA helicase DeaD
MNVGEREGIDPKRLLGIINDVTGDKSINVGSIEVTNKFTFFDIFADQVDQVVAAFAGQSEVEVSEAKGSKSFEGGSRKPEYRGRGGAGESRGGGYRGGDRGGDRGSRPAASGGGGEKPWRNRDLGDRSSRPSSGGERSSERRSSGGYKGASGSSYKKR